MRGTWRKVTLVLAWIIFLAALILFFCVSPVSSRAVRTEGLLILTEVAKEPDHDNTKDGASDHRANDFKN